MRTLPWLVLGAALLVALAPAVRATTNQSFGYTAGKFAPPAPRCGPDPDDPFGSTFGLAFHDTLCVPVPPGATQLNVLLGGLTDRPNACVGFVAEGDRTPADGCRLVTGAFDRWIGFAVPADAAALYFDLDLFPTPGTGATAAVFGSLTLQWT